jgi:hypothetical protein
MHRHALLVTHQSCYAVGTLAGLAVHCANLCCACYLAGRHPGESSRASQNVADGTALDITLSSFGESVYAIVIALLREAAFHTRRK